MKKLLLTVVLGLMLVGTAHAQTFSPSNFSKIKKGMSVKEVRALLGKPVEEVQFGNGAWWRYKSPYDSENCGKGSQMLEEFFSSCTYVTLTADAFPCDELGNKIPNMEATPDTKLCDGLLKVSGGHISLMTFDDAIKTCVMIVRQQSSTTSSDGILMQRQLSQSLKRFGVKVVPLCTLLSTRNGETSPLRWSG